VWSSGINPPYIPLGLTIVSFPKICLQVPAISSNALVSLGVMGAGFNDLAPIVDRVTCDDDDLEESSKADRVKFKDLVTGVRTESTCSRVSLIEEVLSNVSTTIQHIRATDKAIR